MERNNDKIQELQNKIEYEKLMPPTNCASLARMEIELAGYYYKDNEKDKAMQLLQDAKSILTDPGCPDSREKRRVYAQLQYVMGEKPTQGMAGRRMSIPIYIRFSGLIILLLGYMFLYLLNSLGILVNAVLYNVGIFGIFVVSLIVGSIIQRMYIKRHR